MLTTGPSLVLVLELMAGGLGSVLSDVEHPVSIPQYKAYIRMMLNGLLHLHQISIMHRVSLKVIFALVAQEEMSRLNFISISGP